MRRFGGSTDLTLQQQLAGALRNKGITLGQLGRSEEAITTYDDLQRRFGDSTDPVVQEQVSKAKELRATALTKGNEKLQ